MDCPDDFAATVPGDGNFLKRARLHDGGYDQDWATASQDDRVSDRQWMAFRRALPLVLAKDDKIGVASFVADTLDYVAGGLPLLVICSRSGSRSSLELIFFS